MELLFFIFSGKLLKSYKKEIGKYNSSRLHLPIFFIFSLIKNISYLIS